MDRIKVRTEAARPPGFSLSAARPIRMTVRFFVRSDTVRTRLIEYSAAKHRKRGRHHPGEENMVQTLIPLALFTLSALPYHPLNQTIGGRDGNLKPARVDLVRENIVDSKAYELMVKLAVAHAQDPRMVGDIEMKELNFGQRTRIILARLFDNVDYVKEWEPSTERGFGAKTGPQPAHPLDEAIGAKPRSGDAVLKSLRESRAFSDMMNQAAEESVPLRRGLAGLNYAEAVRIAIARSLEDGPREDE
jgi:hypothetical protein